VLHHIASWLTEKKHVSEYHHRVAENRLLNTFLCAFLVLPLWASRAAAQRAVVTTPSPSPSLQSIIEGMERAQSEVRPQVAYQFNSQYACSAPRARTRIPKSCRGGLPAAKQQTLQHSDPVRQQSRRTSSAANSGHEVEAKTKKDEPHSAAVTSENYDLILGETVLIISHVIVGSESKTKR